MEDNAFAQCGGQLKREQGTAGVGMHLGRRCGFEGVRARQNQSFWFI